MRILNVSAQKPDATGSGIYLAKTTQCMIDSGCEAGVVCGVDASDSLDGVPAGAKVYPVRFNTPELPFDVCGMSDIMPYPATRYRDMTPEMTESFKDAFRETLRKAIRETKPDAIICHHLYLAAAIVEEVVEEEFGQSADRPKIYGLSHSTDIRQLKQHGLERDMVMDAIPHFDGIFALHEDQRKEISGLFGIPEENIEVVGVGYDDSLFNRQGRTESKDDSLGILYAGKISFPKGVPQLIDAVSILDRRGIPSTLVLAGGHSNEEQYDEIVEKASHLRPAPEFVGQVAPEQLAELYKEADIFVLPSFFEGLPLVVLEALACGCRVVVTDLPGIRKFFDKMLPVAPIYYVQPPRMTDVDKPVEGDLPEFSERLADAVEKAASSQIGEFDATPLSWRGITRHILEAVEKKRS